MVGFASNWAKSYRINRNVAALEKLSDSQLNDIGIARNQIRKVVTRSVEGL